MIDNEALLDQARNLINDLYYLYKIPARIFGSVALLMDYENTEKIWNQYNRPLKHDLDILTLPQYKSKIYYAMRDMGYITNDFNIQSYVLHDRPIFYPKDNFIFPIELYFNPLIFHHNIDCNSSFIEQRITILPTELFLSKIQHENLPDKHLIDLIVILDKHLRMNQKLLRSDEILKLLQGDFEFKWTFSKTFETYGRVCTKKSKTT